MLVGLPMAPLRSRRMRRTRRDVATVLHDRVNAPGGFVRWTSRTRFIEARASGFSLKT